MKILIKKLSPWATIPEYQSEGAAAVDLHADLYQTGNDATGMEPGHGGSWLVPTGLSIAIPSFMCGIIMPRSGLGHKRGLVLGNGVGVIDSDYRGEIFVSLLNRSDEEQEICHGDRIAQMLFMPVHHAEFEVVEEIEDTYRGEGGFGSTGD